MAHNLYKLFIEHTLLKYYINLFLSLSFDFNRNYRKSQKQFSLKNYIVQVSKKRYKNMIQIL